MSPEQVETLWDAFEKLDGAAAQIAYSDGYVTVGMRKKLKTAIEHYRRVRDATQAPSPDGEKR